MLVQTFLLRLVPITTMIVLALSPAIAQTFIPIDHKGEPVSSTIAYYENLGQLQDEFFEPVPEALYYSMGSSMQVFALEENLISLVLAARDTVHSTPDSTYHIQMQPIGENVQYVAPEVYEMVPDHLNYILGHCPQGIFNVQGYKRIVYANIYPHIDLHLYSNDHGVKFYLVLNPGADPNDIQLKFTGQDLLDIDYMGHLEAHIGGKYIRLEQAVAYQQDGTSTTLVPWGADYQALNGNDVIGFYFGSYDTTLPLILDISSSLPPAPPQWNQKPEWGTFFGGTDTDVSRRAVALSNGGMVVGGGTFSTMFPVIGSNVPPHAGGYDSYFAVFDDQYSRTYATFYGGDGLDALQGLAVTPDESAVFIVGITTSATLLTQNFNGGGFVDNSHEDNNTFLAKFSLDPGNTGTPLWQTRFGEYRTRVEDIQVDANDNLFITGLVGGGSAPVFPEASCTGTLGTHPVCDQGGTAYFQDDVVDANQSDAFLAKFDEDLNLVHSTLFGGELREWAFGLSIDDPRNRVYITGYTTSPQQQYNNCEPPLPGFHGFPLCDSGSGYFQDDLTGGTSAFVAAWSATGMELQWSTFFCGSGADEAYDVAALPGGDVYITGSTHSSVYSMDNCNTPTDGGFPSCALGTQYHQPYGAGVGPDAFVARFDGSDFHFTWSSFIGGGGRETARGIAVEEDVSTGLHKVVLVGRTVSGSSGTSDFPLFNHPDYYYQTHSAPNTFGFDDEGFIFIANELDEPVHSTYFGGVGHDDLIDVAMWDNGRIYVVGTSWSEADFPFAEPPTINPWYDDNYPPNVLTIPIAAYAQVQYDVTVGVDEVESSERPASWWIEGDPGNGSFTVAWGEELTMQDLRISIMDMQGRMVHREELKKASGSRHTLALGSISSGLYLVQLFNAYRPQGDAQRLLIK